VRNIKYLTNITGVNSFDIGLLRGRLGLPPRTEQICHLASLHQGPDHGRTDQREPAHTHETHAISTATTIAVLDVASG
jgi:hypothetical protein